jgi:spore cortex formation protein SpoVR/YcgB (stage V sporulation)
MASMARGKTTTQNQKEMMDILEEAKKTCVDRGLDYGDPMSDFSKIANLWDVIFQGNATMEGHAQIKPEQVALAMIAVKIARICQNPDYYHRDSVVDIAGYAACLERVAEHRSAKDSSKIISAEDIF